MSRRKNRPPRSPSSSFRPHRRKLVVELLEDRSLLDAGLGAVAAGLPQLSLDPHAHEASSVMVRFRPDADAAAVAAAAGASLGSSYGLVPGLYQVNLSEGVTVEQALTAFRADARVEYAEPDYRLNVDVVPNDQFFNLQYGLNNTGQVVANVTGTADADIDAVEAWNVTTGSSSVIVAVIDSGTDYNHPDLAPNIWQNNDPINGVDDDNNGFIDDLRGWDFFANDNAPLGDGDSHGTHTAGTIGAVGNNSIGVTGVAWNVRLMPVRFLGPNGGSTSGAISAINYAVANGATILNNSWGGGGFSSSLQNAIVNARNQGVIFVAAAGNSGTNNDTSPFYPANYNVDNVVAVAATDSRDQLPSFSNRGVNTVDIAAPGVNIASTVPGGYAYMSGTSMAAPHVAGVMALVKSVHPEWTYSQVIAAVLNSADVRPSLNGLIAGGRRLNANAAVNFAFNVDNTGPRVVSATVSPGNTSASSVRLTFSEAINVNTFSTADVVLTNPGGTAIATGLTQVNSTTFDVTFATQTAPGTYTIRVGPNIADTAGNLMDQDQDGTKGEATQDQFVGTFAINNAPTTTTFSSGTVNVPINDNQTATSSISVGQDVNITDVNVRFRINHTWDADLVIVLRFTPTGGGAATDVTLVNRRGGSANNFGNSTTSTTLDDEAGTAIANGSAPFAGTFRPDALLSAFDGKNARGTWQLRISDVATQDVGTLLNWSLIVTGTPGAQGASVGAPGGLDPDVAPPPVAVEVGAPAEEGDTAAPLSTKASPLDNTLSQTLREEGEDGTDSSASAATFDEESEEDRPAVVDSGAVVLLSDLDGLFDEGSPFGVSDEEEAGEEGLMEGVFDGTFVLLDA